MEQHSILFLEVFYGFNPEVKRDQTMVQYTPKWVQGQLSSFQFFQHHVSSSLLCYNETFPLSYFYVYTIVRWSCLHSFMSFLFYFHLLPPVLICPLSFPRDRLRTTTNVLGDSIGAGIVEHLSRHELERKDAELGNSVVEEADKKPYRLICQENEYENERRPESETKM